MEYGMLSHASLVHTLLLTPISPRLTWDWTYSGELVFKPTKLFLEWRGYVTNLTQHHANAMLMAD